MSESASAPVGVLSETTVTLADAAARLPRRGGKPVHPSTLTRWILRGARGPGGTRVRLEAAKVGSAWFTSAEAIERFVAALSAPGDAAPAVRSPARRKRASEKAGEELEKHGC